jgi:hypothetical protein
MGKAPSTARGPVRALSPAAINSGKIRRDFHLSSRYCLSVISQSDPRKVARPAGLEPATPGLEGRCSIQLSYGRVGVCYRSGWSQCTPALGRCAETRSPRVSSGGRPVLSIVSRSGRTSLSTDSWRNSATQLRVSHGHRDALVAERFLNRADAGAIHREARPGFIGERHTATQGTDVRDCANNDPFSVRADDRIDRAPGRRAGGFPPAQPIRDRGPGRRGRA